MSIKIVRAHQPWNNLQLYADLGILRAPRLKHCGIYLAQRKFNARIIKISMVEGTNESFLARKLSELKISNSSGPCACIHLLLVSIARSFTLHVYTRKGTSKRFVVVHYQVSKCIYKFLKFSYFLTGGKDLESLAEDYFGTRPVEEDDDQLDDYGSDSSDETNQEIDSDDHFDFSNCDTSER